MTDLAERIRSYYEAAADPIPAEEILAPATRLEAVRPIQSRIAPARPRPWPALAGLVAALLAIGGVALLLRGGDGTVADETTPAAAGGFSCPPGSTPDQPGPIDGPRPPQDGYMYGATTFDPGSGRVLRLTYGGSLRDPSGRSTFWTFDVCTNAWASEPLPEGIDGAVREFVYDVDSDRFIAFAARDEGAAQVWTYEPDRQTWTEKDEWVMGPTPEWGGFPQAVYDPVSGLVVVREPSISAMWTYDVDTDTWTEIDQGTTLPLSPAVARLFGKPGTEVIFPYPNFAQRLTYDASVDRLILYDTRSTWEFDIRAGRWEEQDATHDDLSVLSVGYGWAGPVGDEFTYDEANQVSVLFSGALATYDASEHTWTVLQQGSRSPAAESPEKHRGGFAMTYDSVNKRILVFGGGTTAVDGEWEPTDEVIAYDVATGEWITLLEPTSG